MSRRLLIHHGYSPAHFFTSGIGVDCQSEQVYPGQHHLLRQVRAVPTPRVPAAFVVFHLFFDEPARKVVHPHGSSGPVDKPGEIVINRGVVVDLIAVGREDLGARRDIDQEAPFYRRLYHQVRRIAQERAAAAHLERVAPGRLLGKACRIVGQCPAGERRSVSQYGALEVYAQERRISRFRTAVPYPGETDPETIVLYEIYAEFPLDQRPGQIGERFLREILGHAGPVRQGQLDGADRCHLHGGGDFERTESQIGSRSYIGHDGV